MIYFDNSASSPLCEEAKKAIIEIMEEPANPSSLHRIGFAAARKLESARKIIADSIGAKSDEIIFTSGGTESDNLGIFGAAEKMKHFGKRIITSDSEHPAVTETLKKLGEQGFEIKALKTRGGKIDEAEFENALTEKTALITIMHTNNETGAVYDIKRLSRIAKELSPETVFMTDCVQGYLKGETNVNRLGVDIMTLSSHKVHGPKGVGALYIRKGLNLKPIIFGGGQERGLRNGTENLVGIVGFGAAVKFGMSHISEYVHTMNELRDYIVGSLFNNPKIKFNLPEKASSHIISMQVEGYKSEVLLHKLSDRDIFISSGSACSSHKGKSPVLANFGLSGEESDRTIRISLSAMNTLAEAEEFVTEINKLTLNG